ncbi:undecaprenyl-diphosphate phosphatase [Thermococcus sp. GR6]|uniref:undecaprenyl-diphosphate phosphatase n=1 Tax=Thermococcus sp. GR6 TaxID=1638256 RepID=UPI00143008E3|nr:undecaprenyl-diphosphate phosphatase [Thermococcus sp. GR6]NJE42439.1 undecaprenyl-diphosphate phosphatase [Thermococcus sp. GR6]
MIYLTEYYLPLISGIIVALSSWFPISPEGYSVNLMLQSIDPLYESYLVPAYLGILFAILFHFREKIATGAQKAIRMSIDPDGKFVFYSSLFTVFIGYPVVVGLPEILSPKTADIINAIIGLVMITAGLLMARRVSVPLRGVDDCLREHEDEPTLIDSLVVGLAQGISLIGGISRSGLTLTVLLSTGASVKRALELSFLVAPLYLIMRLAFIESWDPDLPVALLFTAFLASFATSILTMNLLLRLAESLNRRTFLILFGSIAVIVCILGVIL